MAPFVSTIEIARRPEEVYAYVTDPFRFPEWQKDVVRVTPADDRPPGPGTRYLTTRRFAGAERTLTQEIVDMNPPRTWAARGLDGPIAANASILVEPLDGGTRSRVTFTLDLEGRGMGVTLMPLVRRQVQHGAPISYANLKRLLETGGDRAAR